MREWFAHFGKGLCTLIGGLIGLIGKMGKNYILFSLNADLETRNHGNQHDVKDYYALANECGGVEA